MGLSLGMVDDRRGVETTEQLTSFAPRLAPKCRVIVQSAEANAEIAR